MTDCAPIDEDTLEAIRTILRVLTRKQDMTPKRVRLSVLTAAYNKEYGPSSILTEDEVRHATRPLRDAEELAFIGQT